MASEIYTQFNVRIVNRPVTKDEEGNLINKSIQVKAYHDCALFHVGKGLNFDNKPYGIITSNLSSEPFKLSRINLKVYLTPGMISCYGRQIEVLSNDDGSKIELGDFRTETAYDPLYANVFLEVNLNDSTNQLARIYVTKRGGDYIQPSELVRRQNDLHKLDNGIYWVPLVHFQYHPLNSETPFDDFGYDIDIFNDETRGITTNLRPTDTINSYKINELFNDKQFLGTASNRSQLTIYNNLPSNKKDTEESAKLCSGYSYAKVARKFGIGELAVEVNENLIPLITAHATDGADRYGGIIGWNMFISSDAGTEEHVVDFRVEEEQIVTALFAFRKQRFKPTITFTHNMQVIMYPVTLTPIMGIKNLTSISWKNGKCTICLYADMDNQVLVQEQGHDVLKSITLKLDCFTNKELPRITFYKIEMEVVDDARRQMKVKYTRSPSIIIDKPGMEGTPEKWEYQINLNSDFNCRIALFRLFQGDVDMTF